MSRMSVNGVRYLGIYTFRWLLELSSELYYTTFSLVLSPTACTSYQSLTVCSTTTQQLCYREKVLHRGATDVETNKTKEPWVGVRMPGYADEPGHRAGTTATTTTTTAPFSKPATTETGPDTGVEAYMKETAATTKDKASHAGDVVKEKYEKASQEVGQRVEAAEEKAKEMYHSAVDTVKGMVGSNRVCSYILSFIGWFLIRFKDD